MNAITQLPQPAVTDAEAPTPENIHAHSFTPAPQPDEAGIAPGNPWMMPGASSTPSGWGTRYDGWTPERQKLFLEAISEGRTIKQACRIVGLSPQSAYAFRRRPQGAGFSLAWQAACLLTRDELADDLMDRARNGVTDTVTRDDGTTIERHRHDNRLAMAMLNRLDRLADRAAGDVSHAAARLVAAEFDAFVDLLGQGPARAGVFLGARAQEAPEADLAPIRALARADRWLRSHAALAGEVDASDLDPAQRGGWSGEQWSRAEDAGLVALAPPAPEPSPSAPQLHQPSEAGDEPVWWDDVAQEWRTRFPAPPGFCGEEDGEYGEEDYSRTLSEEEEEAIEAPRRAELAERARIEAAERDELFGFTPAPSGDASAGTFVTRVEAAINAALSAAGVTQPLDATEEEDANCDDARDEAGRAGEIAATNDSPPCKGGAGGGCERSEPSAATGEAPGGASSPAHRNPPPPPPCEGGE